LVARPSHRLGTSPVSEAWHPDLYLSRVYMVRLAKAAGRAQKLAATAKTCLWKISTTSQSADSHEGDKAVGGIGSAGNEDFIF